ncbi:MAG: flagellar filament capping protein FliD [Acidobacteriota bacterium]
MAVSLTSLQAQIQSSADEYAATLTKPITALKTQKTQLTSRSSAFSTIKTRMTAMQTSAKALLSSGGATKFSVYSVSSTLANVVTATASSGDSAGTHSLLVSQLAKNDMALSSRFTNTDTTLASAIGTTTKSFQMSVNGVDTQIDVTLDGSENNQAVLTKIAAAINAKSGTSGVSASAVGDTASTSKLVFTSKSTGASNKIVLSEVGGGNVLDSLGLSSAVLAGRTASTSGAAGFTYSDSALLDSKFTLDGIEMVRSSNTVTDALQGVSLSLKSVQLPTDTPSTLTVALDQSAIKTNVQDFLNKYNDLISIIRETTSVDQTTKVRQILSEDTTYVQMRTSLRLMVMGQVSSVQSGNPSSLSALGITADANGRLSISDLTKFNSAITGSSSSAIADVFVSSNGVAAQMSARMEDFVKTDGILDSSLKSTKDRMTAVDKKVSEMTARNDKKVQAYKDSLAQALSTLSQLSTQQQLAASYASMYGS